MRYLSFLFLLFFLNSCKKDEKVEACFTYNDEGLQFSFFSHCSEGAESWEWNFGDNSTSIAADPFHTFKYGIYTVSLRITASNGKTSTVSKLIDLSQQCRQCLCGGGINTTTTQMCGTPKEAGQFCSNCEGISGCRCN